MKFWINIAVFMMFVAGIPAGAQTKATVNAQWCKVSRPPQISITTDTDKINWVFNLSQSQLNNFNIDTVNPYERSIHTDVGGLMKGGISMTQTMKFNTITHKGLNQSCIFYDSVRVQFKIEPNIYIAREYPVGSCKHNAIKGHELKHINMDRQIVNKYAMMVGREIKTEIDKRTLYGPASASQLDNVQELMRSCMESILRSINKKMEEERRTKQQAIDNIKEYERVNNLCR